MSYMPVYGGQEFSFSKISLNRLMRVLALIVATCLAALPLQARAESTSSSERYGLFLSEMDQQGAMPNRAPTLSSAYSLTIEGPFARATVVQSFTNTSDHWQEAVYKFPIPSGAAVDQLRVRIGEREIVGVIDKKEQAQQRYEAARDNGQVAALLSAVRENMFALNIANIPPKEQISVTVGFDAPIDRQGMTYRLLLPLVLAPRYHQGGGEGVAVPRGEALLLRPPAADGDGNKVTIDVSLDAGVAPNFIRSTSHNVQISETNDKWQISLDGPANADRMFSLEWQLPAADAPRPALFTDAQNHTLLTLLPPDRDGAWANAAPLPPREVILVLDRSGSMDGSPIRQARNALRRALDSLRPIDRVNVISFDDRLEVLFDEPQLATDSVLRQAHHFIKNTDARGGTEMLPAMVAALSGNAAEGMVRQVVLATDALIGYEDHLLRDIAKLRGEARIFPIAIGAAPNDMLIRWAADVGQGAAVFISHGDPIEERMNELLARLSRPALTDIRLDWHGVTEGEGVETLPIAIPDLFYGEPLVISARLDHAPAGVTIRGRLGARDWSYDLTRAQMVQAKEDGVIGRAFGKAKLAAMRRQILGLSRSDQNRRAEAINIATDHAIGYGLVSPYTSLIAIEQTVTRPADQGLVSTDVPLDPPAGADLFSQQSQPSQPSQQSARMMMARPAMVQIGLPQTATPAPLLMLIGALIMGIGLLLLMRLRVI